MSSRASHTRQQTLVRTRDLRRGDIAQLQDGGDETLIVVMVSDLDPEMRGSFVIFTDPNNVALYRGPTSLADEDTEWLLLVRRS